MKTTGYKESLEQYKDLVDKKGFSDYLGDAFSRVGSGPAQGASQRMSNAILSGLGSGVSGAAADERKEMLSPYLEQAGRITAKAAELEAQMQQAQSYQLAINEFGQKYTPLVAEFAAAVNSNDPRATMMFKDLVNKAQMIPGFENLEGDSWNPSGGFGLALNTQTGEYRKITADEIVSAVAPAAQTIYGDQWFEKFMPLNAGFAKDAAYAFNMKRQEDALGLEGKRADVNLKQAHAGVYQQQANQIQNEMQAPKPKYSEPVMNKLIESNQKWVNELAKEHQTLESQSNAYKQIASLISKEKEAFGRAGSGIIKTAQRAINKSGTESERNQALIELYKQPLMAGIKQIFAGATSDYDIATFMAGLPSLDKNPDAAIQVALERAAQLDNQIQKDNLTRDIVENEFGYSEPYNSLAVQNRVKERFKPATANTGVVTMAAPDGSTRPVPAAQVEYWKSKGAKVVDEQK
ncbi:MAG: hypothetical protein FJX70_06725 [Alphaproteobacteria bacterium]|nr:hypothetical protein [Alphaproteobacteria bacterium]